MKPCSLLGPNLVHPPPLQDYIITYHDGNEVDITETLVDPDDRPTSRPRRAGDDVALPVREAARQLVKASFLKDFTDDELAHMASRCMEQYKIDSQHPHSKLRGNRIYYECGPDGRKCIHGAQHKHNRTYVEFRRSGERSSSPASRTSARTHCALGSGQTSSTTYSMLTCGAHQPR